VVRKEALFLALLLSLFPAQASQEALSVQPGSTATLVFPEPSGEAPRVDPPLRLLFASDDPPYLVLVEVPEAAPPGVYRVCLGKCRTVRVEERRSIEVRLQAGSGSLLFRAKNRGNLPESLFVRPAEGSEVRFAPFRLELAPGEAKELEVPLRGHGLLVLVAGERRYLLRVEPEGGPPPPTLRGTLFLSTEGAQVEAGVKGEEVSLGASLSRAWSGQYRASLMAATSQGRLLLDSGGSLELGLAGRELGKDLSLGDAVFRLNPDGLSLSLSATFPSEAVPLLSSPPPGRFTLGLQGGYSFRQDQGSFSLSLARDGWSFTLGHPFFAEGRAYLPEFRGALYARVDGTGGRFRLSLPPYTLEWGLMETPFGSIGYASSGGGLSYRLRAGYQKSAFLEGGLSYRTGTYGLSVGGFVGSRASLYLAGDARLGEVALRGLVSYPFSGSPSGFLEAEGRLEDVKVFLRGELSKALAFRAGAVLPFSLDLPELQGLFYPSFALLQGKTLPGGEVRVGSYRVVADSEGRFALRLPPGTYRVSAFPPAGVLALPVDQEVRLSPGGRAELVLLPLRAAKVRVVCEGGTGRVRLLGERANRELACGESALLPEGVYRVVALPEKDLRLKEPFPREVSLTYGEELVLRPLFEPEPLEVVRPAVFIPLALFALAGTPTEAAALGEALWVRAPEAKRVVLVQGEREVAVAQPSERGFLLRVPLDLPKGVYLVQATGEEGAGEKELRVDPGRPLFRFIFTPPRPAPGERVEVRLEARTLLREARLHLPWGGETLLSPEGEGWVLTGFFVLPPSLPFDQVVALDGVAFTPEGTELPFQAAVKLRPAP